MSQALSYLDYIPAQVNTSSRVKVAAEQAARAQVVFKDRLHDLMTVALEEYEWKNVVMIAIDKARLTEADIARELELSRSTVNRWYLGKVLPPKANMAALGKKLIRLVNNKLS